MKLYEILFSPTGGTSKVAQALAAGIGPVSQTIDLLDPRIVETQLAADALAIIAVPSFGGRVPSAAADRLPRIHGNGCAAVLVCVYGNRAYDDTLRELQHIAEQAGFRPAAAVAAVAEHSVVRQYASGRPDEADRRELQQFGQAIAVQWQLACTPNVPGHIPDKAASSMRMVPRAGRGCTSCGLCARQCPMRAINPSSPRKADRSRCISCMRCVQVCPSGSRRLNPLLTGAAGLMLRQACLERKANTLYLSGRQDAL